MNLNRKMLDDEFKGSHIFQGTTLIQLKDSVCNYGLCYNYKGQWSSKKIWKIYIEYFVKEKKHRERYITLVQKEPKIMGSCTIEGKRFLIIGEK